MITDEKNGMAEAAIKSRRPTRLSLELLVRAKKKELLPIADKAHEGTHGSSEKSKLK
jgi:hypothetical protein